MAFKGFKGLKKEKNLKLNYLALGNTMTKIYDEAICAMRPAIDKIIENYTGFDYNYVDEIDMPQYEIDNFLCQLNIYYPGADKVTLKLAIRQFLTTLGCWHHRVVAKDKENSKNNRVWNPLEKPLKIFLNEHRNAEISYKENNEPYPTADIISDWISDNINEHITQK